MLPYQPIIQPTLRPSESSRQHSRSPEKPTSTPKYVLKVPIPSIPHLHNLSSGGNQPPTFSDKKDSGHKENNLTFDQNRRWNLERSEEKAILGQSAKKLNTEIEEGSSLAEKSFTEAAQKIARIKILELENKVQLLVIENERLTTFLNDQFQENEKLTQDFALSQQQLQEMSKNYDEKLNIVLMENEKLQQINNKLEQRIDQITHQRRLSSTERENEILKLQEEAALKIKLEVSQLDQKRKSDQQYFEKLVEKYSNEKVELEYLITEQQRKIMELEAENKSKEARLGETDGIRQDLECKVNTIELMGQTILNQEARIKSLEERLDVMVADNKQLQDVNDQFNQKQRQMERLAEERKFDFERELQKQREQYENEVRQLSHKQRQKLEEIKFQQQDHITQLRQQIEGEFLSEMENLRFEIELKQNELTNQAILWKDRERDLVQENKKELDLKELMINSLKEQTDNLKNQMDQVQHLVEKMQKESESTIQKKEQEIVKMAKSLHQKDQASKQLSARLDEICNQVKILEEQRDDLSDEMTKKQTKAQELEMKLDIVVRENETLLNQVNILEEQLDTLQKKYDIIDDNYQARMEDMKIQIALESQAQVEQCIMQYQEQIKYEQDRIENLEKDLKKSKDRSRHFELLGQQYQKDMGKLNQRIEELVDVCEQTANRLIQIQTAHQEKEDEVEEWKNKFSSLSENYELQIETIKKQMFQIGTQNEEVLLNHQQTAQRLKSLETSYNKVMKDLADQTQAKLDLEQSNKRLKAQLQDLEASNKKNFEEAQRYKSQVYQHQQEIEELTRSQAQNYSEKEYELQNKYEGTISELKTQLNQVTSKYNDLARKERDNRFRLKLLKKNSSQPLPYELEQDDCYETIRKKMEDQSEYLRRLILENDDLKERINRLPEQAPKGHQSTKKMPVVAKHPTYVTEDTDRTVKLRQEPTLVCYSSQKKMPGAWELSKQIERPQKPVILESKQPTMRTLDRDVYLNAKVDQRLFRQSSMQRI